MQARLLSIQKSFVISIVMLATMSVVTLAGVLYATNVIRLHYSVSSAHLESLTKDYPELSAYIESQKAAEPHFIKIANLVKSDQQKLIGRALLYAGLPVLAVSGFIGFVLAKRLLEPVEESFASQERFLQDAGHEMRNPLAALSAVIQEAQANPDPKSQQKALGVLDRQVAHLVKLNEDLLLLERTKQASKAAHKTNVSDLALDVIESATPQANKQKIKLKASIKPETLAAISDRDFVCIARNVIENAIKYSTARSTVNITLESAKQQVVFSVKDKGIGIPKDQLGHIGERFYRAENVGRKPGTGLGMAIVYQLVHNVRGTVRIKSTEGKGTLVEVRLPAAANNNKN